MCNRYDYLQKIGKTISEESIWIRITFLGILIRDPDNLLGPNHVWVSPIVNVRPRYNLLGYQNSLSHVIGSDCSGCVKQQV